MYGRVLHETVNALRSCALDCLLSSSRRPLVVYAPPHSALAYCDLPSCWAVAKAIVLIISTSALWAYFEPVATELEGFLPA